jgi:hypothetical protein
MGTRTEQRDFAATLRPLIDGSVLTAGDAGYDEARTPFFSHRIVTANGEIRTIDAEHDPELFWAIRGGGGNFGVVTRFQYRLVSVPEIYGGVLVLPATARTISDLAAACAEADDGLTVIANIMPAPPLPFLPEDLAGTLVVIARVCYSGPAASATVQSLRGITPPIADLLQPMPYAALFAEEAPDRGQRPAIKTMFIEHVDTAVAATILEHPCRATSWLRLVQFRVLGGAISQVPADATAYAHRSSKILVNLVHGAEPDPATASRWTREVARDLYQRDDGAYVNFLGPDDTHQVASAYPGQTLTKLRRVKAAYDPTNLFRNNVNITPQ